MPSSLGFAHSAIGVNSPASHLAVKSR
jgi:hypothetical protein